MLPVDALFQAAPVGGRDESAVESRREVVPRNRALDLPAATMAPLVPVQGDSSQDRDREREEERNSSWLRPVDFLGEDDLPPVEPDERDRREPEEEEVMDWGSLREMMAAREMEAEDLRERAAREAAENGQEREDASFSIRDRTAEGISMAPVQGGRERQAEDRAGRADSGTVPGTGVNEPARPAPVLQPAMRMAPVMGGGPAPAETGNERLRERPSPFAGGEGGRSRFSEPATSRFATPAETRQAPGVPVRVERPSPASPSPVSAGTFAPAIRNEPVTRPQLPTVAPASGPSRQPTASEGLDIRRFRPEEFSIRPNDPWSRP